MNKTLITFLLIIITALPTFAGVSDKEIKEIFPKVDTLEGGAELWLNTGYKKNKGDNHTVYSTTYSYYSGKSKKLMNIIRKKQYSTNIALYSFNNFVDAAQYFRELTKDAPKNRSQQVRFGERGLFFIYPKSGYINDADFYLVFINKTFVVWIHADDGFALMDIANPVNEGLEQLIMNNTKMYLLKKLSLEVAAEGYEVSTENIEFTNDFPSSIKVSGKVFKEDLSPLKTATVNILQTGDSIYTDKDGYFEHTIMLDGLADNDIELSANFYMKRDESSVNKVFSDGLIESTLKNKRGKEYVQLWKLETAGEKVFGTAYIKSRNEYKGYPISGKISGEDIKLRLDCSKAETNFRCEQNFTGKLSEKDFKGEWTGTGGGGSFHADTDEYSEVSRKVIISKDTAQIKTFAVDFDGKLQRSDDNILNIASGTDSNAMVFIKPIPEKMGFDNIKTVNAKLVLTHLPQNQSGSLSIFKYHIITKGTEAFLGRSRYAGQLYKSEEPYKVEIDVTDMLKKGEPFIIGGVPEAGSRANHLFSPASSPYASLKPYITVTEYSKSSAEKTVKPFRINKTVHESTDRLGDRNKPRADGLKDYCFDASFSYKGKKLTSFELEISNGITRRYNTDPLDIYPLVGIVKNDTLLNSGNGSLNFKLANDIEKLSICINGSYKPKETDRIIYKYTIDGKPVEGIAE